MAADMGLEPEVVGQVARQMSALDSTVSQLQDYQSSSPQMQAMLAALNTGKDDANQVKGQLAPVLAQLDRALAAIPPAHRALTENLQQIFLQMEIDAQARQRIAGITDA